MLQTHPLPLDPTPQQSGAGRGCWHIAVLIPCWNEEQAVAKVVGDFRKQLPDATIYVYDNNSRDRTQSLARDAGAIVRSENLQGKGHVVRRMFADVEADIYLLVDGDDTYDACVAPTMVDMLLDGRLDMVNALRMPTRGDAYRRGHRLGNQLLSLLVCRLFGNRTHDVLSGYRAFSRRFVKSFPALSAGFETETEFTIHALELNMPIGEIVADYRERPAGSRSKLHTVTDGLRILHTILVLLKQERPFQCFAVTGLGLLALGFVLGVPVVLDFLHTGLVPRLPTALLATGTVLAGFLAFFCGLVLDSVSRGRKELKRLAYLAIPATGAGA